MIFLQLSLLFTVAMCAAAQTDWDSDERFGIPHPFPGENYHPGMSELPWEEYPSFPDYPHDFPPYYETSDMFHDGHNSHWRDACFCLGFNPDIHREAAECMYAILYSAEQYLSNDHGELISHLYNARTLLDDFLHEDSDHFSSSEWPTSDWWETSSDWSSSDWSSSDWSSSDWSSSEWDTSDFNEHMYIWTNLGDITCGDGWVEGILVVENSNGDRGTVCDDIFDASSETASIMCRNLGFEYGEVIDRDGSNTGLDIVLDNVDCNGDEYEIGQCRRNNWGDHDCSHSEDVGLRCYQHEGIEEEWVHDILTGGSPCLSRDIYWPSLADVTCGGGYVEGLVVVENHHNERGTICGNNFDNDAATAVCRSLGYEYGERIDRDGSFTEWDIALAEVTCPADVWGLDQCDANPWGEHDCTHAEDVGVKCYSYEGNNDEWVWDMYNENHPCLSRDTFWPSLADITCGDGFVEGLVVLENHHNERGTICGNAYDDEAASAACKSMGYESGEYISRDGEMTGYDIALGGVSCPAAAWGIQECTSNGWGNYECTHADDLGVRCFEHEDYVQEWVYDIYTQSHPCLSRETYWPSLGDVTCGEDYVEGLLLVTNHFQEHGTVCDDNFNDDTATVFCRSMGYEGGEMLDRDGEFTGYDTVLDELSCPAAAWNVEECTSNDWADHDCAHSEDVGLRCYSYPESDSHMWVYDEYYNVHPCEERNYPLPSGPFPEPVDFPEQFAM